MSKQHYVYTLARPDGRIFYVGKGTGHRIRHHELEALRGHDCAKCRTIREIWQRGGTVQRAIVFQSEDEQAAYDYEAALIRDIGREQLTNRTDGGHGGKRKARVRTPPHTDYPYTTLAERLQYLRRVRLHPEEQRPYKVPEIVAACQNTAKSNMYMLLNGQHANPTRETLIELAMFFQVPVAYFFPELDQQVVVPLPGVDAD